MNTIQLDFFRMHRLVYGEMHDNKHYKVKKVYVVAFGHRTTTVIGSDIYLN